MTIINLDGATRLRVDGALEDREKHAVLKLLDDPSLPGAPGVMKPREWVIRKKSFTPIDGYQLVLGWVVRTTDDAYLFSQEPPDGRPEPHQGHEGTDWVPRNDVVIFQRSRSFTAPPPKRSLMDRYNGAD